ncbi:hypothetical protein Tco_0318163 [Tanacetum coccineum]
MEESSVMYLNLEVKLRDNALVENKKKLEKAEKERDELKLTLEKFQNSSKSLNNLLESQVIDKFKTGLVYNAASSTLTAAILLQVENFVNSSEMIENAGDKIEPKTVRKNIFRPPVIEDWNSEDEKIWSLSKPSKLKEKTRKERGYEASYKLQEQLDKRKAKCVARDQEIALKLLEGN